ncbi:hypothetical protein PTTG_09935 [Puccinia triticina 1-1 BBBD Race 1]|uniref:Uncharacterized protein n=1 Tax=Puccinia triticina (isolate 1-1 / race 1 (BBBD)) TaxID=630390 RepID=A0A180G2H4_PUCT1|nr:hypothetical protein PTTG_09935 [Puccinia triticina 1-1 BBBD Race 1]
MIAALLSCMLTAACPTLPARPSMHSQKATCPLTAEVIARPTRAPPSTSPSSPLPIRSPALLVPLSTLHSHTPIFGPRPHPRAAPSLAVPSTLAPSPPLPLPPAQAPCSSCPPPPAPPTPPPTRSPPRPPPPAQGQRHRRPSMKRRTSIPLLLLGGINLTDTSCVYDPVCLISRNNESVMKTPVQLHFDPVGAGEDRKELMSSQAGVGGKGHIEVPSELMETFPYKYGPKEMLSDEVECPCEPTSSPTPLKHLWTVPQQPHKKKSSLITNFGFAKRFEDHTNGLWPPHVMMLLALLLHTQTARPGTF